ncbi:hypothetical protein FHX41_3930 [Actinomadura hallensis]|uniref:Uncharacterized protein n=1 Tax=Actinomadura hallensis TaxID=337895 RepID=A0A543II26_9ACTN|nr:hypothetical protein [Actinomadura hallensis]TQM70210.1 hypothetical protein FHX41_3930 [Actinomadura hallensis]
MRQIRSADPWSAFLNTRRRPEGARPAGAVPPGEPGPADPDAASGAESGLGQAERRVLARLRSADGHMSLEQLHHATGLGLLEVAEAVDALRGRGLVSVEREIDEIVRLTEG